jgi:hypothetical protein
MFGGVAGGADVDLTSRKSRRDEVQPQVTTMTDGWGNHIPDIRRPN